MNHQVISTLNKPSWLLFFKNSSRNVSLESLKNSSAVCFTEKTDRKWRAQTTIFIVFIKLSSHNFNITLNFSYLCLSKQINGTVITSMRWITKYLGNWQLSSIARSNNGIIKVPAIQYTQKAYFIYL